MLRYSLFILLIILSVNSFSATLTWNGSVNSDWNNSANWTPAQVPTSIDNVIIAITANEPILSNDVSVSKFTLNSDLNLGGYKLKITGNSDFYAGIINGELVVTNSFCLFDFAYFNLTMSVTSESIYFKNTSFSGAKNYEFIKTGATNDFSVGGNFFGMATTTVIKNQGTGDMVFGNTHPDFFQGNISFINESTSSQIRIAENTVGNVLNGDIVIIDNGTSLPASTRSIHLCKESGTLDIEATIYLNNNGSKGIYFGENGGQTTFSNTSSLNSNGFIDGELLFANVTSQKTMNINFMANTASLKLGPNSIFNQNFTATAPRLFLNGATYNAEVELRKTGASNDFSDGGNIFPAGPNTTIYNQGTGDLVLGNVNPDIFNGAVSFINESAASEIRIAENSSGNQLNDYTILNNGTAQPASIRSIHLCKESGATLTINGLTYVNNNGSAGIYFGKNGGQTTLSNTSTLGTFGFIDGELLLSNITSNTPIFLTMLANTASLLIGPGSVFNQNVTAHSPRLFLNGATYNAEVEFRKNGASNDFSEGGNIFSAGPTTSIYNQGTGDLVLGNVNPDIFNGAVSFINESASSQIRIAENSNGNQINDYTTVNNGVSQPASSRSIHLCKESGATLTINGLIYVNNNGSAGIYFGENGGQTTLSNTATLGTFGFVNGELLLSNITSNTPIFLTMLANTASLLIGPGSVFNQNVTAHSPRLFLNGATYNAEVELRKNGASNDFSEGGNVFSAGPTTTIYNQGTGDLVLGNVNPDIFNGAVSFINESATSQIRIAENSSGNQINGFTTLNNGTSQPASTRSIYLCKESAATMTVNGSVFANNNGSAGIYFGLNGGQTTLSNTATLGTFGFIDGELLLSNITSNTPIFLTMLANTASLLIGPGSVFNQNVTAHSPRLFLNGATYNAEVELRKNGASNDFSEGGNVFSAGPTTTIYNQGTGDLVLGNVNPDIFNGAVSFINESANSQIRIAENSSGNQINGFTILNNGTSQPASTRSIYLCKESAATMTINGSVFANNNGSAGIYFGLNGGQTTLSNTSTFGSFGFVDGELLLSNLTSNTPIILSNLTNTASLLLGPNSIFNQEIDVVSPRIFLNGATYNAQTELIKSGDSNDLSNGGNIFSVSSDARINNQGTGDLVLGNINPDVFNGNISFINETSNSHLRIAENSIGNQVNGFATFDNGTLLTAGTRSIHVCREATSSLTCNGSIFVNNNESTGIFFGENGGETSFSNTSNFSSNGFLGGTLLLANITSNTNFSIAFMNSNASLIIGPNSEFNNLLNATSPRIFLNGLTANGLTELTKSGSNNDNSNGGNIFNAITTLRNSGTGEMNLANLFSDTYFENLNITGTSTGNIDLSYSQEVFIKKNINYNTTVPFTNGVNSGLVTFDSNILQTFSNATTNVPIFNRIRINKPSNNLTLNNPIKIGIEANLSNGIIFTSIIGGVSFLDNSDHINTSNTSFINGSVSKVGDDFFIFPVGKQNQYRPCAIENPAAVTDVFTAEYFPANSNGLYPHISRVSSINNISTCDYWTIDRTNGASNVEVYLSWSTPGCNGIVDLNSLIVSRWDATLSEWQDHGNGGIGGDAMNGNIRTLTTVNTFSPFALASIDPINPLPIELISFEGEFTNSRAVELHWSTATEYNSDHFILEKSIDGLNFSSFDTIVAAGFSQQTLNYNSIDFDPLSNEMYYRLKQFDLNGEVAFSSILFVSLELSTAAFTIVPNPVIQGNNIQIKGEIQPDQIKLIDATGKTIKTLNFQPFLVIDLPKGVYQVILLKENQQLGMLRMIVV